MNKLANGLFKLDEAQANSNELQKSLAVLQSELGRKSDNCTDLLIQIDRESLESQTKKEELAANEAMVGKEKAEI